MATNVPFIIISGSPTVPAIVRTHTGAPASVTTFSFTIVVPVTIISISTATATATSPPVSVPIFISIPKMFAVSSYTKVT